jgi:hypothetical protein
MLHYLSLFTSFDKQHVYKQYIFVYKTFLPHTSILIITYMVAVQIFGAVCVKFNIECVLVGIMQISVRMEIMCKSESLNFIVNIFYSYCQPHHTF